MQYDALLDDVRTGLESGRVEEGDLRRRRLADRSARPDVAGVLRAAGAIVFLFGLALVFGVGYDAYPHVVKLVGPFGVPGAGAGGGDRASPARARRGGRSSSPAWSDTWRSAWPS